LTMLNIGWLSTGRGEGSKGLLRFVQDRILRGQLDARIEFVFSNREAGEAEGSDQFIELVKSYDIPYRCISSKKFRASRPLLFKSTGRPFDSWRAHYDLEVMNRLEEFEPDVYVLAGYMLIVGIEMSRKYSILNLHPALPDGPIGTWQEVIWQLIESGASHTGAMMHLATEDVDRGPVVSHCTVPLTGGVFPGLWEELEERGELTQVKTEVGEELPLFQLIRQMGYQREPYLLFETLRCVAEGRVTLSGSQVLDREGAPLRLTNPAGLCLDQEINRAMAEDGLKANG